MPDFVGEFREFDPLDFFGAIFGKKTNFDFGRVRGKNGKIDALPIPPRTTRIG
jgi:hypothetical protein